MVRQQEECKIFMRAEWRQDKLRTFVKGLLVRASVIVGRGLVDTAVVKHDAAISSAGVDERHDLNAHGGEDRCVVEHRTCKIPVDWC